MAQLTQQGNLDGAVLIAASDMPLLDTDTLDQLLAFHERSGNGATVLTTMLDDPTGYGRIIRDSDGTKLSDEILDAGYDIYSTLCIIRDHNEWAKQHPECLQQSFLSTDPVIAAEGPLTVRPMAGFFAEQFRINDRPEAMRYWQVWDRTADKPLPAGAWRWDASSVPPSLG